MIGSARNPICRHNAQVGDLVGITGFTGESAIGLRLLQQEKGDRQGNDGIGGKGDRPENGKGDRPEKMEGKKVGGEEGRKKTNQKGDRQKNELHTYFESKHITVKPGIREGLILGKYVNALIDVSDGLLIDLKRILTASGKGAHIRFENLPVTQDIKDICGTFGWDVFETVLAGGEDYVLLFTVSEENELRLKEEDIDYTIIGKVNDGSGKLTVTHNGKPPRSSFPRLRSFQQAISLKKRSGKDS